MSLRSSLAGAALAVLSAATLPAQAAPPSSDSAGAPVRRLQVTAASLALADTLLRELNIERVMRTSAMAGFDAGTRDQPAVAQLRSVMEAWVTKHMSWAELGPEMTRVYAELFTQDELRALVAFYRTPVGRRLAELTPELSRRGAEIGAALAARHSPELQQMMMARMAELQGAGKSTP